MPRPQSPPYTLGTVATRPHPTNPKAFQARGYYRDGNGRRVDVTATGKTAAGAKRELETKVNAARDEHRGGDSVLNQSTPLPKAASIWLDWKEREGKSPNTMRDYRGYVDRSIKVGSLANLTVSQANDVARIEAWLVDIADNRGETAAKQSRKVLSGILSLAERRGAIPASVMRRVETPNAKKGSAGDNRCTDPECDYDCGKRHLDTRRAFTAEEAAKVLEIAETAKADVGDLAHFLFGTGARISEALHCTSWADVDLDNRMVRIRGTKTKRADRTVEISTDLAARLKARSEKHGTTGLVFGVTYFATKAGQPRDRNNVSAALRRVFKAAGVEWAGTHTMRRTTATWMSRNGSSIEEIANQLGHADTSVTFKYLGRSDVARGAASAMVLPAKPVTETA